MDGGVSEWHIRFLTHASLAAHVRTNVPYPALQKRTVSTKSTQMNASIAVPAQAYVPLRLPLLSNCILTILQLLPYSGKRLMLTKKDIGMTLPVSFFALFFSDSRYLSKNK